MDAPSLCLKRSITNAIRARAADRCGKIPVLGGFIGSTVGGLTTTLGRGGSDYTAALLGAALGGSRSADLDRRHGGSYRRSTPDKPREYHRPSLILEAAELAYLGKVLHPKTIQPAVEQRIPVRICNAREPVATGTIVCSDTELSPRTVKAIAHKTGITLVQITSARMLGAYSFLHAIFEVFNRHRTAIDIVTIGVSVSLSLDDVSTLATIVDELKRTGTIRVEHNQAIICVVGEGLRATPRIAGRIFNCLGDINDSLISHGASSVNVTFVVEERTCVKQSRDCMQRSSSRPQKSKRQRLHESVRTNARAHRHPLADWR